MVFQLPSGCADTLRFTTKTTPSCLSRFWKQSMSLTLRTGTTFQIQVPPVTKIKTHLLTGQSGLLQRELWLCLQPKTSSATWWRKSLWRDTHASRRCSIHGERVKILIIWKSTLLLIQKLESAHLMRQMVRQTEPPGKSFFRRCQKMLGRWQDKPFYLSSSITGWLQPIRSTDRPVERSREKSTDTFSFSGSLQCGSLLRLFQWNKLSSSDMTAAEAASTLTSWAAAIVDFKQTVASLIGHHTWTTLTAGP